MFVDYDLDFVLLYCFGHLVMLFCTGCFFIQCWFRGRGRRGWEIQRVSKESRCLPKDNSPLTSFEVAHLTHVILTYTETWVDIFFKNVPITTSFVKLVVLLSLSYSLCKHTVISCIDAVLLKSEQRTPQSVLNGLSLILVADRSKQG